MRVGVVCLWRSDPRETTVLNWRAATIPHSEGRVLGEALPLFPAGAARPQDTALLISDAGPIQ